MTESDESFDVERAALSLWGKSTDYGAARPHLLLQHLYDTLAVGELIWDEYLGDPVRSALDAATEGRGRQFFALLCGIHDVGKATPVFQSQSAALATRVQAAGLRWTAGRLGAPRAWHHTLAGARIFRDASGDAGWSGAMSGWVWPMIGGHHGVIPAVVKVTRSLPGEDHGITAQWRAAQRWLVDTITAAAGYPSLADAEPGARPPAGVQLAVSGSIIMADWLASNQTRFEPIDAPTGVSVTTARTRAARAWRALDLRTGMGPHELPADLMRTRFGRDARPLQVAAESVARRMPAPGLVIVEASMGEGKTEAALLVAEILIERFGLRGVFVGMPTQATSDPMFSRVHGWSEQVAPDAPIILLHGKRRFNKEFQALQQPEAVGPIYDDEQLYGVTGDVYGTADREHGSSSVVDWFLKNKRGLLSPIAIGTIDNLLHAGTRTAHVMLRHTGLAQKVVILDEVHAATVYMSQFLKESLRWLGSAGVPVVVLTATLPPALRRELAAAYLEGPDVCLGELPDAGYPSVTAVGRVDPEAFVLTEGCAAWRDDQTVSVHLLKDVDAADHAVRDDVDGGLVADHLRILLADGGTALVIRNTVDRAQRTFERLSREFGDDVELLHARLMAGERADRTERELSRLGAGGAGVRPRHILVATQVAEQSFDVDADVLITDLAPIDLLLQRIGRIHRHERGTRQARLALPAVYVSGFSYDGSSGDAAPEFPDGARAIYGDLPLLRSVAFVLEAAVGAGWVIPRDIPHLVAAGYGDEPTAAEARWPEAAAAARAEHLDRLDRARNDAQTFLLKPGGGPLPTTLNGLNASAVNASQDERLDAVVRDGERSVEVALVHRGTDGAEQTLSGLRISDGGVVVADDEVLEQVFASVVRLPAGVTKGRDEDEILKALPIPDAWRGHPYLRFLHPLVLDNEMEANVRGRRFRYDQRLGLVDLGRRKRGPRPENGPAA